MEVTEKTKRKISKALTGRKFTDDHKKKISESMRKSAHKVSGNKNGSWMGDKAGVSAMHKWIVSQLGRPMKCEECSTEKAKRFEWSNIDHKYRRDIRDYRRLCPPCHRKYDFEKFGTGMIGKYEKSVETRKKISDTLKRRFRSTQVPSNG